jgi:hypothetical protein
MDVLALVVTALLFAVSLAYVGGCDRLKGDRS